MITGFNHSGFVVKDIEAMVAFYQDTLGLSVMREVDSVAPPEGDHTGIPGARRTLVFVGKPEGEHVLELVHFIDPPSPEGHLDRHQLGAAHICFNVTDLGELASELKAQGIRFVTDPIFHEMPDGKRRGICYIQDPEGNYVELIQPTT